MESLFLNSLTCFPVPQLLTVKRLFVTLDLPYSAVRGEDVCFTALTFNRYPEAVNVSVVMTCTTRHETIEEAVEVSVVMTCTTHHETIEAAVEVSVVITCTIHHESVEVAGVQYTMTVFK